MTRKTGTPLMIWFCLLGFIFQAASNENYPMKPIQRLVMGMTWPVLAAASAGHYFGKWMAER